MADYSSIDMVQDIVAELTEELEPTDDQFNATLLAAKVVGAYREVRSARRYPSYYAESSIETDMETYYSNVYNLALYDYNKIGMEGQTRNAENEVARTFVDRPSLFSGVIPLSSL